MRQKVWNRKPDRIFCRQDFFLYSGLFGSSGFRRCRYVYICENNTIYGTKFKELPNTKGKTLVADVSSCFLSEPVDVTKYGVIYGGVQKNIGPAGVVIVIIREDLITEDVLPGTPTC